MNKKFIKATQEYCTFEHHVPAPYIRKKVDVGFPTEHAELSICGLGFYRLYLNGIEITKGALAPYINNPDHICYYDTYDIKQYLKHGENVIGIVLGNGFYNSFGGAVWDFDKAEWIGAPRVALEVVIQGNGQEIRFAADESFKVHPSSIIFDELRMGEYYDANLEVAGWNMPGFDDSSWANAMIAETPRGELKRCEAEPIRVMRRLKPQNIIKSKKGYIYDFGENTAGVCELAINAERGQKITFWHGELLQDNEFYYDNIIFGGYEYYKEYNQKSIYIAKGDGNEHYIPSFTYFGFRYVLVEGITEEQATEDLLTYHVMNSDLKIIGDFSCSDQTANTLFEMVKRSDLANFYYFPTDCPHREKNGWTGDASMSADHMAMLYDVEKSWREWLVNIRKCQINGEIPVIIPTDKWGYDGLTGPAWDSVLFNLPYMLYKYRGCKDVIIENSNAMLSYLEHMIGRRNPDGTIAVGFGDWVPVGKLGGDYDAPLVLTTSIMAMDIAKKAAEMFQAVGYQDQAEFAYGIYQDFYHAIRNTQVDFETMTVAGNCQSSQAFALYYGIFKEEEEKKAFQVLLDLVHKKNDNFDCGILGMHVLFHVLAKFNQSELAFRMITKKEYPSYGSMIENGDTALTESFWPVGAIGDSHNHHFMGDIGRWFMQWVAGLHIIDSKTVELSPAFIQSINNARASYELPLGTVSVEWERRENDIMLKYSSPEGVKCTVNIAPENHPQNIVVVKVS